jgi:HEAT repeats
VADLISEVAHFQEWAGSIPPEHGGGEWECDYENWSDLYEAVLRFVEAVPFANWSPEETRAVLFAIARDNEMEYLADEIRGRKPETLVALAAAAVEIGERNAKWQLAEELGQLGQAGGEAERLLLILAHDEKEYVRRRALQALARIGSPALDEMALAAWRRPDDAQQWTRMNVLWCLQKVGSPHLQPMLAAVEQDGRQHLVEFADKIKRGEVKQ